MNTTLVIERARTDGWRAYQRGELIQFNPHPPGAVAHPHWRNGWKSALLNNERALAIAERQAR